MIKCISCGFAKEDEYSSDLGLTRDAVRSFCKRNNLGGNGKVVSLNIEVMKEKKLLCLNCGRLMKIKDKGRPRNYCSDDWLAMQGVKLQNKLGLMKCLLYFLN